MKARSYKTEAALSLVTLGIIVLAPLVITIFAPGFLDEPGKFELTVSLTRWMGPFLLFIGLSAFCMGMLNTHGLFALPAAAPIILNITMIAASGLNGTAPDFVNPDHIDVAGEVANPTLKTRDVFSYGGIGQFDNFLEIDTDISGGGGNGVLRAYDLSLIHI